MRKYLTVAKISLQEDLIYRANFLFYFLDQTILFLTQALLWSVVFRESPTLGGFNLAGILQYFIIIYLVRIFTSSNIDYALNDLIISGDLSRFLVQPWSIFIAMFFHEGGKKTYRLIYFLATILILSLFGVFQLNLAKVLIFFLMLVNVALISFFYRFVLGSFAFWATRITSFLWFFHQSADFLGGGWLPASFFPLWATRIIRLLPFYLTLGFPAEFFQGKIEGVAILSGIGQQFIWIVILFFLVALVWKKGIKAYEAVGN